MHTLASYSSHNPRLGRLFAHSPYAHIRRAEHLAPPNRTPTTCHLHYPLPHLNCSHARQRMVQIRPGTAESDLAPGPSRHIPTAARHTHMPSAHIARVHCQARGGGRGSCANRPEQLELQLEHELDERVDLDVHRASRARRRAWRPDLRGGHWGRGWLLSHPRDGGGHPAHCRQLHRAADDLW